MFLTDRELCARWRCSKMKLYRMRRAGKIAWIRPGGCGPYLTHVDEIARIEGRPPPENASAANSCSTRSDGGANVSAGNRNSSKHSEAAAPVNGVGLDGGGNPWDTCPICG